MLNYLKKILFYLLILLVPYMSSILKAMDKTEHDDLMSKYRGTGKICDYHETWHNFSGQGSCVNNSWCIVGQKLNELDKKKRVSKNQNTNSSNSQQSPAVMSNQRTYFSSSYALSSSYGHPGYSSYGLSPGVNMPFIQPTYSVPQQRMTPDQQFLSDSQKGIYWSQERVDREEISQKARDEHNYRELLPFHVDDDDQ